MNGAITVLPGHTGRYQDVLDAAEFHARKCGSKTNALVSMARESAMYAEWIEAETVREVEPTQPDAPAEASVVRPAETKALPPSEPSVPG